MAVVRSALSTGNSTSTNNHIWNGTVNTTSTNTATITIGASDTFVVGVLQLSTGSVPSTTMSCGGQSMTNLGSIANANDNTVLVMFGLVSPTSGSKTITATSATATNGYVYAESMTGSITSSVAAATEGFNTATSGASNVTSLACSTSASIPNTDLAVSMFAIGNAGNVGGTSSDFTGGNWIDSSNTGTDNVTCGDATGAGATLTVTGHNSGTATQMIGIIVGVKVATATSLPAGKAIYDRPNPVYWYQSWTEWAQQTPTVKTTYQYYDYPNPRTWAPVDQFYGFSNLLFISRPPRRNYDWPNPQPVVWYQTWTQGIPFGALQTPFNQENWPNPSPVSWYQSLTVSGNSLTTVTQNPFNQFDWPLPRTYQPIDQFWANSLNLLPQPTPFLPLDWPNPPRIVWDRFWSQGIPFGAMQKPFVQSDWPCPYPVQWYEEWHQALAPYLPTVFPFHQTDWQNPRTWSPIDQWWFNNLISLLTATPPQLPFNQSDWPNPRTLPPIDPTWLQALVLNLPEPPPPPEQQFGSKTWTREQWTKQLEAYVRARQPKLLTFSEMGKMGGRPRKHT